MNNNIENHPYDERIEKFLRNEMSPEEETRFKADVSENEELRSRAEAIAVLIKGMKKKGKKQDAEIISEVRFAEEAIAAIPKRNWRPTVLWVGSIAAAIIIMYNIWGSNRISGGALYSEYYETYSEDLSLRSGEADSTSMELMTLFNEIDKVEDCSDIIKELELRYSSIESDFTYRPYANDIAWYLALAYIKNDDITKAKELLKKIIEDYPESKIAPKSKQLLNELK